LDIYVPTEFEKPLSDYLNAVYLFKERLPFEINITGYEHHFEFYSNFSLDAFETTHLQKYSEDLEKLKVPNKMQCYCFLIEVEKTKLFYSADIGSFDDIKIHLDGCKYVIVESTHIEISEFLKEAPKFEVGKYVLSHLGSPDEVENIAEKVKQSGIKNIRLAQDGMELHI